MSILAIIAALIPLLIEILKLIREARSDKKEESLENKQHLAEIRKKKTELVKTITQGLVDRNAAIVNSGFDELRRLRQKESASGN